MSRRRHAVRVTTDERLSLLLMRGAPPIVRALAIDSLVQAIAEPLPHEKAATELRLKASFPALAMSYTGKTVAQITRFARRNRSTIFSGGAQ